MEKRGLGTLAVILIVIGAITAFTFFNNLLGGNNFGLSPPQSLAGPGQPVYTQESPWFCSYAYYSESQRCQSPKTWLVFATDTLTTGNILGADEDPLVNADDICNSEASTRGYSGSFKAWLSTSSIHANNRIVGGKYMNIYGEIIANNKNDLTDGTLDNAIDDELHIGQVWTGTNTDGTAADDTCADWTDEETLGQKGLTHHVGDLWTAWTSSICDSPKRLYCFQVSGTFTTQTFNACTNDPICTAVYGSGSSECVDDEDCDFCNDDDPDQDPFLFGTMSNGDGEFPDTCTGDIVTQYFCPGESEDTDCLELGEYACIAGICAEPE